MKELFVATKNKFIASNFSFVRWVARDTYYKGNAVADINLTLRGGFATI